MRVRSLALATLLASLVASAGPGASSHYDLVLSVDPLGSVSGQVTITGISPADWPQAVLRLYPAAYGAECLAVTGARVGGTEIGWESIEPTTVAVFLAAQAGDPFSLTVRFAGRIPEFAHSGGYGTFARSDRAVVLAQAYPILAPWDGSWVAYPVFPWGDAIVADVASYAVELTVPPGWTPIASGTETEISPSRYRVEGENLRELGLVVVRGYEVQTAAVAGVTVRSFFRPEHRAAGEEALRVTAGAIAVFADRIGPPPFPELDVVAVPLRGAAGVEFPGLILSEEGYYSRHLSDPLCFAMIFAHEAAHQWWYAEIGSDQVAEPWVDEALTTYTSGLWFEAHGRLPEILRYWESSYAQGRSRNRTAGIGSPLWAFPDGAGYGGIVYSGGALFLHAVRERMGDDAFFGALRLYREEFRWQIATGEALLGILQGKSPQPLDDLLAEWLTP